MLPSPTPQSRKNHTKKPGAASFDTAPGRYRILLGTEGGQSRYARIRTLQADIMINNNAGITW